MIGMGAAIYTGETDIAQIMVKAGFGIVGLLIIVFSTVTTTFLDAYSAGASAVSIPKRFRRNGQPWLLPLLEQLQPLFIRWITSQTSYT